MRHKYAFRTVYWFATGNKISTQGSTAYPHHWDLVAWIMGLARVK